MPITQINLYKALYEALYKALYTKLYIRLYTRLYAKLYVQRLCTKLYTKPYTKLCTRLYTKFYTRLYAPTVFMLYNMHLKLMHFRSNLACILGRFFIYIELNLNTKRAVLSVDFIYKMQWFLIYIARRFYVYLARISCIRLRPQRGLIFSLI